MEFRYKFIAIASVLAVLAGCKKDEEKPEPNVNFQFVFDSNQERLDNEGNPAIIPGGNGVQTPKFNKIAANFLELVPDQNTPLGQGETLFQGPTTVEGSALAIDFNQSKLLSENQQFLSFPLNDLPTGTYEYVRVSLSYQNLEVDFGYNNLTETGVLASFLGFNTYITDHTISEETVTVNGDRAQGFYLFETFNQVFQGQAENTTVVNPLFNTVSLPENSCILTGRFDPPLQVFPTNVEDVSVKLSLSTNLSFEWQDLNGDGLWQPDEEPVADMGIRGLVPDWE